MSLQEKHITINVPGAAGQDRPSVVITPGTTAGDVLEQAGLDGYWLRKPGEQGFFGQDEPVWDYLKDGEKLEASAPAQVGAGGKVAANELPRAILAGVDRSLEGRSSHANTIIVRPRNQSYLKRRGWRWQGKKAVGYYRTRLGSWRGQIHLDLLGRPQFYISEVPAHVRNGRHRRCFTWKGEGRGYHIHFQKNARDVDSELMAIEAALAGRA